MTLEALPASYPGGCYPFPLLVPFRGVRGDGEGVRTASRSWRQKEEEEEEKKKRDENYE
jgi:hypothetical protein